MVIIHTSFSELAFLGALRMISFSCGVCVCVCVRGSGVEVLCVLLKKHKNTLQLQKKGSYCVKYWAQKRRQQPTLWALDKGKNTAFNEV